ncbi:MBL fold metallo-hydrolase [Sneathiella sp.]|jgi:glyoxylase-like metal-dependent hydrolase (beta-lactamase superfamily II)|uniref:MBL fold metallo-hydrolase n=1 Tax=Sneathiella sp. TaxID=1964365 RepID=UPI0039E3A165
MKPIVTAFFHEPTFTVTYVVTDGSTGRCAIIDSVLDYDPKSGRTDTETADAVIDFIQKEGMTVDWILETHVHADHLTAAPYLKEKLGGAIGIGAAVTKVQAVFTGVFNVANEVPTDGSQFDQLLADGETLSCGQMTIKTISVPGHTPACVAYEIGDAVFVGDTLFMPDFGTARCDFPGGDAKALYNSIRKILSLPGDTRLFMCHDYAPGGRDYIWETTVAEQNAKNIHINEGVSQEEFVKMREDRDKELSMPVLIIPSVQINIRAGHMPLPEENGTRYLKVPINQL